MSDIAIDTNILLYAIDDFYPQKQDIAIEIIADAPSFCSQTLSEFSNVCLRKWKFPKFKIAGLIKTYIHQCTYIPVTETILLTAFEIMDQYDFQLFDAIIVGAALTSGCSILYSEDMNSGQIINGRLKIVNPFK
jgi:predicted nucleic acid-binding protein